MGRKLMYKIAFFIATMALTISCSKTTTTETVAAGKNLYFATGQCNSGSGITTLTPRCLNCGFMTSKPEECTKNSVPGNKKASLEKKIVMFHRDRKSHWTRGETACLIRIFCG